MKKLQFLMLITKCYLQLVVVLKYLCSYNVLKNMDNENYIVIIYFR